MMIMIVIILLQITWILTLSQVTNLISFSALGLFLALEKLPFELKFLSYQRNAILDSVRSDEVIIKYTKRLHKLGWNESNRQTFHSLMDSIEKEQRIQQKHHTLLMKTTVIYDVALYFVFLIVVEVIGLISWSQWLNLIG
jgi:hypothetical protein